MRHKPMSQAERVAQLPKDRIGIKNSFMASVSATCPKPGEVNLSMHMAEQDFSVYLTPQEARLLAIQLLQRAESAEIQTSQD